MIMVEPVPKRPAPLRIDELAIAPPILLAPMSGLTNLPMRTLCEEAGCGLTVTEFLAAPALAARVPRELRKLTASQAGRAFGVQIFGRHPEQMARAARLGVESGAALVDINMGCPAKKVTKGVAGAALMKEPILAAELVQAVVEAAEGRARVTVKIRSGWDQEHKNAPAFAAQMVEAGARAVAVHGRTRMQGFTGEVDLSIISEVKRAVTVPVIGNGDVTDLASLERMFVETGCDGVMVGRAALGNPWIFERFAAWWWGQTPPDAPTHADRVRMYLRHLDLYLELADPERAVIEMRKFAGWYLRGFPNAATLRKQVYGLTEVSAVQTAMHQALGSL
jgi:tRNA-dihydrouridine synthase B